MPSVAARDYRCSWEIPYDFHPRIHAYRGATSVVRAYMDGTAPAATKESSTPFPPPPQQPQSKTGRDRSHRPRPRHYRLRPSPARVPDVQVHQVLITDAPSGDAKAKPVVGITARTPQPPRPAATQPSWQRLSHHGHHHQHGGDTRNITTSNAADEKTKEEKEEVVAHVAVKRRPIPTAAPELALHTSTPRHTTIAVGHVRVPAPPHPSSFSPPSQSSHQGYGARTKLRYTLPSSHAAHIHQFERQSAPSVTVADRHASPPTLRELRLSARRVRCTTRAGFVDELRRCTTRAHGGSSGCGDMLPADVLDRYTDTTNENTFDVHAHNFSAVLPDVYEDTTAARAASLQSTERRMWRRLVVNVAPLAVAQAEVQAAGGVSVVDSGHVTAPITIACTEDAYADAHEDGVDESEEEEEAMAVVVMPFADELAPTMEAVRLAEAQRVWSRGREWDRQAAIRCAVGTTAQEAIVTLGIDRRYRQPGDYLLQRNRPQWER